MQPETEPTSITNYHLEQISNYEKHHNYQTETIIGQLHSVENLASEQVYYLKKISRNISAVCIVLVLAGLLIIGSLM